MCELKANPTECSLPVVINVWALVTFFILAGSRVESRVGTVSDVYTSPQAQTPTGRQRLINRPRENRVAQGDSKRTFSIASREVYQHVVP